MQIKVTAKRQEQFFTPNGNTVRHFWVVRDEAGKAIDFGRYRNDLKEKYSMDRGYDLTVIGD
ncbi:hypothetical protein D3C71_1599500 [compost metagenome]